MKPHQYDPWLTALMIVLMVGFVGWGSYTEYQDRQHRKRQFIQMLIEQSYINQRMKQYDDSVQRAEYRAYWTKRMEDVRQPLKPSRHRSE